MCPQVMCRQLSDELVNKRLPIAPNPFFFVKRAHTDRLNEKYMAFFFNHLYSV